MGRLESTASDEQRELGSTELIGRSRRCSLQVDDPSVSAVHATLRWDGTTWMLSDTNSTNGTFVDGARVDPANPVALRCGCEIRFGNSPPWRMVVGGAPIAHAIDAKTGSVRLMEEGLLELGDGDLAVCVVSDGQNRTYQVETPNDCFMVEDGEPVEVGGRRWVLRLPEHLGPTVGGGPRQHIDQLSADFSVSADEEHVAVTYRTLIERWDLATKAHHYTLLTLARHRIADQQKGIGPGQAGWIDREAFLGELKIGENLLYTHIFRARKELAELGVDSAATLVERRPGAAQIRIGISTLSVNTCT